MTDRQSREADAEMTGSPVELWRAEMQRRDPKPDAGAANVMAALVRQERDKR